MVHFLLSTDQHNLKTQEERILFLLMYLFFELLFSSALVFSVSYHYHFYVWRTSFSHSLVQIDHNMNFMFAYMWFNPWETLGGHKKPYPAKVSCVEIHETHTPQTFLCQWPQFTMCVMSQAIHKWRGNVPPDFRWPAFHHFTATHKPQPFWRLPPQVNCRSLSR